MCLVAVACLLLISLVVSSVRTVNPQPVNQVDREEVRCISAICTVTGTYGQNCSEFKPKIAHIYQTTDVNEPGAHRLVISLNDNSCKG
ncbi:hypothetical protein YOLOSWAG_91 [Erwinia phage vB_EamM_Yoloswag]|uniref:Uncharacterized protein n=1 Tax=Erwinia phage vB_EamM_Yoloswag TaxID=1958956 RepID=A0A1S6L3Q1_9CAUD|nr:hypothetical protein HOR66_gp091 [Erwinia phage vB_EamM_Yoloswag]AQT28815.1 hypothetical protein YOLOSWAG_91 [Erwinia phage vB_EamM_Yoloswag]